MQVEYVGSFKWFVYVQYPIDAGWNNLLTVVDAAELICDAADFNQEPERHGFDNFISLFCSARTAARRAGWEGDCLGSPRVFWIPCEGGFRVAFVWKQSNNGTTFVASPFELPWLDKTNV